MTSRTALLLVDHGSARPEANAQLEDMARLAREECDAMIVVAAHMEMAPPDIAEGFARCVAAGATLVVITPYFLAPGRHSTEDIPRLAAQAARDHPGVRFIVAAPLGLSRHLARAVRQRFDEAKRENE